MNRLLEIATAKGVAAKYLDHGTMLKQKMARSIEA